MQRNVEQVKTTVLCLCGDKRATLYKNWQMCSVLWGYVYEIIWRDRWKSAAKLVSTHSRCFFFPLNSHNYDITLKLMQSLQIIKFTAIESCLNYFRPWTIDLNSKLNSDERLIKTITILCNKAFSRFTRFHGLHNNRNKTYRKMFKPFPFERFFISPLTETAIPKA